jgi:nucleoside-diphosphate-sugar epimerase
MHVLLGAGGVISQEMVPHLVQHNVPIRLVSRNPKAINGQGETFAASLLDARSVAQAVKDAEVVYLLAGLPYRTATWQAQWPVVMRNAIEACKAAGARLVFFDNVYMYGLVNGPMTEQTPHRPNSKKGKVRAEIAHMLMDAVEKGAIQALIARSADFYGPNATNTFLDGLVFKNLAKGKSASWLADASRGHSFTYTPDAGRATAQLGLTPDAFNQVWHLPTNPQLITGEQFIALAAAAAGSDKTKPAVLKPWMLAMAGWFDPLVKETGEMLYQYTREYHFDSSKFERKFGWTGKPYAEGIRETMDWAKTTV